MTEITIPESTLRDIVAAQIATRFSDPEIVKAFVSSILETKVDGYGRVSTRPDDPTMIRWTIEQVIRKFVEETAKAWLAEHHDILVAEVGEELAKADIIKRIAQEAAEKVRVT